MTEILAVSVALATLAGGITVVTKLVRFLKKMGDAVDDWQGEPARHGVPARPGVMERLATIEEQLHPNHGSTLRDVVNRVENGVRRVEDGLAAHLDAHREGF
ncbi:hypothetical protein [Nonomuraea bangladeshensis]|uniref:hypothetical protein n=1 Tax=Nonomuraea bangladeshensis TaxID=404385 RepID=UPI0031DC2D09